LEIQISKLIYKAREGAIRWENLWVVGQPTIQLQSSGSDSPELIKVRGRHYKPSMDNDRDSVYYTWKDNGLIDSCNADDCSDLFLVGYEKLQVYSIRKVVAYMNDTDMKLAH
jgi:hypothetical protein